MSFMPSVDITKSQVDNKLSCTVCYDDFKVNESAVRLPCNHCFHDWCIATWLKSHSTCPNCRMNLDDKDEEEEERDHLDLTTDYSLSDEELSLFTEDEEVVDGDEMDVDDEDEVNFEFSLSVLATSSDEEESLQESLLGDTLEEDDFPLSSSSELEDSIDYCLSNISVSVTMDID